MDLDSQMQQVMEEKDDVLSTFITPFQMINYTVLQIQECSNKQPHWLPSFYKNKWVFRAIKKARGLTYSPDTTNQELDKRMKQLFSDTGVREAQDCDPRDEGSKRGALDHPAFTPGGDFQTTGTRKRNIP